MDKRFRKAILVVMLAALVFHVAFHVSPLAGIVKLLDFPLGMWILAVFAVLNALLLIGAGHTLVFFALGAGIGFLMEQLGVQSGLIFGEYHYTGLLGFKIGDVPLVIACCWFMIVYIAHVMTNLMISGSPVLASRPHHRLLLAFVTALVATAYDVAMDPSMSSHVVNAWVWEQGGDYLGVPFRNYGGWMMTAFAIDYLYRSYAFRKPPKTDREWENLLAAGCVLGYAGLGFGFMAIGQPPATQLITFFVMGIPTVIAAVSLLKWKHRENELQQH